MKNVRTERRKRKRISSLMAASLTALLFTTVLYNTAEAADYSEPSLSAGPGTPGQGIADEDGQVKYADDVVAALPALPTQRMLPESPYTDRRKHGTERYNPNVKQPFDHSLRMSDGTMRVTGFLKPVRAVRSPVPGAANRVVVAAAGANPYAALEPAAGEVAAPTVTASSSELPPLETLELPPASADGAAPQAQAAQPLPAIGSGVPAPVASATPPVNSFLQSDKPLDVVPAPSADTPSALAAMPADAKPASGVKTSALKAPAANSADSAKSEKVVDPTVASNIPVSSGAMSAPGAEGVLPVPKLEAAAPLPVLPPAPEASETAAKVDTVPAPIPAPDASAAKMGAVTITSSIPSIAQAIDKAAEALPSASDAALALPPVTEPVKDTAVPALAELPKLPSAETAGTHTLPTLPPPANAEASSTAAAPLPIPTAEAKPEEAKPSEKKQPETAKTEEPTPVKNSPETETAATETTEAPKESAAASDEATAKPYKVFSGDMKGIVIDRTKKPDEGLVPPEQDVVKEHKDEGVDIAVRRPSQRSNYDLERAYDALMDNKQEEAIEIYKDILLNSPRNRNALFGLATTYHKIGKIDEAKPYYQRLLSLDPGNKEALNNYLVIVAEEAPQEAINQLEKLEEDNPRYSPVVAQLALLYQKEGNAAMALRKMVRAASLSPNNMTYVYNLAVMYDKEGVWQQAAGLYQQLVDANERGEKIPAPSRDIQERLTFIRSNSRNKLM